MTNENIIKQLKRLIPSLQYADDVNAVKGAIQALSQEPKYWMDNDGKVHKLIPMVQELCTDTVSIRKDILKCRVGKIVAYNVEWLKKHWQMEMDIVCGVKPCDDAISRDAFITRYREWVKSEYGKIPDDDTLAIRVIKSLPSVTQKSGKWIDREVYDADRWKCSICGRTEQYQERYCPNCGAKMESEG